jgi:3-dehydroquinate synthase
MTDPWKVVAVALGDRSYDVRIGRGILPEAGALVAARFGTARCAVVTDEAVARHHLAPLMASLGDRARGHVVLPPGEQSKSFARLGELCDRLLALGVERGDLVVALGGGVIGDLAGFAAAILRRGVRFVQIPTTLLAQVDSSVGGKTGINTTHGKNLVGAFHQPSLVLADIDTLSTLPARQMRAGYAEVVKYGLLGDRAFFERLETGWPALFGNDAQALLGAVETSVAAKAAIVARDETEQGDRMLLNLGHTFGHALEAWAGFSDRLLHGEAVAIGMAQAFRYSEAHKLCPSGTAARVARHLTAVGLPVTIADIPGVSRPDVDTLVTLMTQDKKVRDGRLTFILARGVGDAFVSRDVERPALEAFLGNELKLNTKMGVSIQP